MAKWSNPSETSLKPFSIRI
ncbi:uncharacterized protein G2W53_035388 [Senna tora]|uniref:Uncharacterized protein n=1 Tax=Senna tora TaxID=362788 RepID=A0A834SQA7_9FABA|nr:uncharacterized protein G2W53_035388 [Senna tora]